MDRERFEKLLNEYGDAQVFIKGPVSNKVKYNIVTTDLDNKHIRSRANKRVPVAMEGRVLTFSWDQDDFRQINPNDVVKVIPLSDIVNNPRVINRR